MNVNVSVSVVVQNRPGESERARKIRAAATLLEEVRRGLDASSEPCDHCARPFANNHEEWLFERKLVETVKKLERWAEEWRTGTWTETRGSGAG